MKHQSFLKPDRVERLKSKYIKPKLTTEDEKYLREQQAIALKLDGKRCRNPLHIEWITTVFGVEVLKSEFTRLIDPDHLLGRHKDYLHNRFVRGTCRICHDMFTDGVRLPAPIGFLNNNLARIASLSMQQNDKDFRHPEALQILIAKQYTNLTPLICQEFGVKK